MRNTEIMVVLKKYGWTVRKEAVPDIRNTTLKNGSIRSKNMKEKQANLMTTACCSERQLIQQFAGSEMRMDLRQRKHGRNQM